MQAVELPFKFDKAVLACGADLKGRFCLANGSSVYISDEFGDLSEVDNMERYQREIERFKQAKPQIVACDLHPGYFSTKFAQDYAIRPSPRLRRAGAVRNTIRSTPPRPYCKLHVGQ